MILIRIIFLLLILSFALPCFADVVLHRYTNKITSDEEGVCFSDKDGNPAVLTPERNVEIIDESEKEYYVKEHQKQLKAKQKAIKDDLKAKKKIIKDKLKAGDPLSQQDVDLLVGESN